MLSRLLIALLAVLVSIKAEEPMGAFPFHALLQRLLITAVFPLVLIAAGMAPAFAATVIVPGANGGTPGGAAPLATANAGPNSDPSNTAKAIGGNGGAAGNGGFIIIHCFFSCPPAPPAPAGGAGGDATATATTPFSSSTATTATSIGGTGGAGGWNEIERCNYLHHCNTYYSGGVGGVGGTGDSSATVSNTNGSATATATATGGKGGVGGSAGGSGGAGGTGGDAVATSSATGGAAGTVLSQATAYAGAGGAYGFSYYPPIDPWGYGGTARAYATGVALTGNVQATASAYAGWALVAGTAAVAHSDAKNSKGEVLTTASAPRDAGGISPSAVTSAGVAVGSGSTIPISLNSSQVVSDAILTLTPIPGTNLETIGEGAMSAAFSGGLLQQTYAATAVFDFQTSPLETLDLKILSDKAVGIGFNRLTLQFFNLAKSTTTPILSETFPSVGAFFAPGQSISLPGTILAGSQSIEIDFSLSYWNSTGITPNASFGFTYALVDPPIGAPEPSTWAMMLLGFTGLGYAGLRRAGQDRACCLNRAGAAWRPFCAASIRGSKRALAGSPRPRPFLFGRSGPRGPDAGLFLRAFRTATPTRFPPRRRAASAT
jgi:hypothetical protein